MSRAAPASEGARIPTAIVLLAYQTLRCPEDTEAGRQLARAVLEAVGDGQFADPDR